MKRKPELVEKWVGILGLQNWKLDVFFECRPEDLFTEDSVGSVRYNETSRSARIRILSREAAPHDDSIYSYDEEKTLVHELMHLVLLPLDDTDNDLQNRIVHQLVDSLAVALVVANRKETVSCTTKESA